MSIRCLMGHDGVRGVYNAGVVVGTCWRCNREIIRVVGGRWYQLPHGVTVRWKPEGEHSVPPATVIAQARKRAPILHKLRKRRPAMDSYFL